MDIISILVKELGIKRFQVENTIKLIEEGNTIPFIARYRKEVTGNLSDEVLRAFETKFDQLRNLKNRQEEVIRLIDEQGQLTDKIRADLLKAETIQKIDDIYRPFRPKRRTRGMIAREKGLEDMADFLLGDFDSDELKEEVEKYIDEDKELFTESHVLEGAKDIIAENISDNPRYREIVRTIVAKEGLLESQLVKDAEDEKKVYEMYYDYREPLKKLANHRVLALNRGEKEKILRVKIVLEDELVLDRLRKDLLGEFGKVNEFMDQALVDSYNRLIFPSIERELRNKLTELAEDDAINVFALNLEPLLMQPPVKDTIILALDPGFRTGCKLAIIDANGNFLDYSTIFPTEPRNEIEASKKTLKDLIYKYGVNLISIGNGTASRETEQLVADLIRELDRNISYTIVNEAGASIYSASQVGQDEFPDLDVSIRGAISIGRRLQDPLSELVKIEPKHIGVGQYQHDLNQKKLDEELTKVVEDVVNRVGVNLNNASVSLLNYVSGISNRLAKNIVDYRDEIGGFKKRSELKKVKGLGPKTFTQCAGFLRIPEGEDILDNTGVHPENYKEARLIIERNLMEEDLDLLAEELNIGSLTLRDIVEELKKPGRDPREDMPKPIFRRDVLNMEDLEPGMKMTGSVRNVVDFGAFIDIGVKQDGLVHISELSDSFVKHPKDLVKVGDQVDVEIIDIDLKKGRISLSMKKNRK